METVKSLCQKAKAAANILGITDNATRNNAIFAIADALEANVDIILDANKKDLENGKANGLSDSLLDRLMLNADRIKGMADGARKVAAQNDPLGKVLYEDTRPNGLNIKKVSVPLGVIGIIFEARPNVTCDAAVLCVKSGNCTVLRGGKEAINSNIAIANIMRNALQSTGLPADCICLIEDTDRSSSVELMKANGLIDVIIPRGGAGLIKATVENATVPVIETGTGNCHLFVDESADLQMAADIIFNAKCSRPSVCNALETVLVHKSIYKEFLPIMYEKLAQCNTEVRGCALTCEVIKNAVLACEDDYKREFLDYILAARVVDDISDAIQHIKTYTSGHSECIVTSNSENAARFQKEIDAADVYVNASTRFTDGGEFGFGAEIGISTQKTHARGPMGIDCLTSYKYLVKGNGQIR